MLKRAKNVQSIETRQKMSRNRCIDFFKRLNEAESIELCAMQSMVRSVEVNNAHHLQETIRNGFETM